MPDPRYSGFDRQSSTGPDAGPPYPPRPNPPRPAPRFSPDAPGYPPSAYRTAPTSGHEPTPGSRPGYPPPPNPLTDTGYNPYQRLPGPRDPASWDGADSDRDVFRNGSKQPNGFALAGLIFGVLGNFCAFGWIFSLIGLIRAKNLGSGRGVAWTGLLLSTAWVALGWFVIYPWYTSRPTKASSTHVVAGLDPGCIGVTKLFEDPRWTRLGKDAPKQLEADLRVITSTLTSAADKSSDPATKAAIGKLATDYQALLTDVKAKRAPSDSEKAASKADAGAVEQLCGAASPPA